MRIKTIFFILCFLLSILLVDINSYVVFAEYANNSTIIDGVNESNSSLTVAERDVIISQMSPNENITANTTLILDREIWVMNNDNVSRNVTIYNTIPKKDYVQTSWYPLFGVNCTIPLDLIPYVQNYINPNNSIILNNPKIQVNDLNVNYTWDNVTIGPKDAAIIIYINYLDDDKNLYNTTSINLPDVIIKRLYNMTQVKGEDYIFTMNYTMKNVGKLPISGPKLRLFFPETTGGVEGTQLITPTNIISDPRDDIIENDHYNDGTGQMNTGYLISTNFPESLDTNEQYGLNVTINGTIENAGKIMPALIVQYDDIADPSNSTGQMTRIWPETGIISHDNINITRLYYFDVSILIPEDKYFTVAPTGYTNNQTSSSGATTPSISAMMTVLVISIVACCIWNKKNGK